MERAVMVIHEFKQTEDRISTEYPFADVINGFWKLSV